MVPEVFADEMRRLWVDWPLYSGDLYYPVPNPNFRMKGSLKIYDPVPDMWAGKQGSDRRSLLDYMIMRLRNESV